MAEERVQRRLAAILAADVVGYSRLMAADESAALAGARFPLLGLLGLVAASAAVMGLPGAVGLAARDLRRATR